MAAISGSSKNDALYISLLGLAENFRVSNPPNIRLCIHCLQSIFNINPPPLIISRTHLQLGNLLLAHTKNKDLATRHLEQAVSLLSEWKYIFCTRYQQWQKFILIRKLHEFWLNMKKSFSSLITYVQHRCLGLVWIGMIPIGVLSYIYINRFHTYSHNKTQAPVMYSLMHIQMNFIGLSVPV